MRIDKAKRAAKKKAYFKAYYEANKEKIQARQKAYNETHKEEKRVLNKTYKETHKEEISAMNKAYSETHKEEKRVLNKAYHETHREECNARSAKRKALKIQATLPTTDDELIKNLYKLRKFMTEEYGEQYHVDHIIPLSIGGAHHQDNMRVITAKENLEKKDKYIPELGGVWADNDLAREYKKTHGIK